MDAVFKIEEDNDLIQDYFDGFENNYAEIDHALIEWQSAPGNIEHVHKLFRSLHSIKGDAIMCHITPVGDLAHALENLVSSIREENLAYSDELYEIIMLVMDRLLNMSREALQGEIQPFNNSKIQDALNILGQCNNEQAQEKYAETIHLLTGHATATVSTDEIPADLASKPAPPVAKDDQATLEFGRSLANKIDQRIQDWENRTDFILSIALTMNAVSKLVIDPKQLEMAIYLHDFGMLFLPDDILNRKGKFSEQDRAILRTHPAIGADMLKTMQHWDEASRIVLQHHEKFDGSGYPEKISGEDISDGARVLAICDAFYAMTHDRKDGLNKRSLLRAVTEINNCSGTQFCPKWVEHFNVAVKLQHKSGAFSSES